MCCFSRPVRFVGQTQIFARAMPGARQLLAYAMNVELDDDLAMVLPLPTPPRSAEDAVAFVDLESYPRFFADLRDAFPPMFGAQPKGRSLLGGPPVQKLVVHDVGRFEASFVPARADFSRLDERFRLPEAVWDHLTDYADWGFAVFRLKPRKGLLGGTKVQSIHPMAFSFPTRSPDALFFPTVHVHDGSVPARARFDHELYCQADGVLGATLGWTASTDILSTRIDIARAQSLIDGARGGFSNALSGERPNRDTWLRPPADVTVDDLRGRGECHAFVIDARHAYADGSEGDARYARWCETSSIRLAALCHGVRAGLRDLETAKKKAWRLAPLTDDARPHFMNGMQLWSGTSYMSGSPTLTSGPGRVELKPFSDLVSPQSITFGFEEIPSQDLALEIHHTLSRLLDSAVMRSLAHTNKE